MLTLKLALRNIFGAGLRTWLNVAALSISYVTIICLQGLYEGMNEQAEQASIDAFYGGGQYWQKSYDPYDPLTLVDAHAVIPAAIQNLVSANAATPILIRQGMVYPAGRFRTILLKGIDPDQKILSIPARLLKNGEGTIPALIGSRMARSMGLQKGDEITVQWRDVRGTFDAREVRIVEVFKSSVQEIDNDQIWIPLARLQELVGMPNEATILVLGKHVQPPGEVPEWNFKNLEFLLKDLHAMVRTKTIGGSIVYLILLLLAMLAIFDTQVLSIWHRRKEMGTLMALGMTRPGLIALFTLEGALHGILAALIGAVYGIPLLGYIASIGWAMPELADQFGFALGERIFPSYSAALVAGTTLLVLIVTTIVSFLPTRKIASLKPTDALRGKLA
ncbi:MAG: FtsX-like permease family protein [candidate division KSB1 bacterium]|nr:FtsX-like permease family protein [candidate division KSB1 bacterium]MDZ7304195.1 FtsX-like permease family protein [candidate division KSB1 bacterium]MDZ7313435.1 FtsX-like permease family protein [candidate division KSB1 bacterium]